MSVRSEASLGTRLALAGVATAFALTIAWFGLPRVHGAAPSVRVVDSTEEVTELLARTSVDGMGPASLVDAGGFELVTKPLDRRTANKFMSAVGAPGYVWNELMYYRRAPRWERVVEFSEHAERSWTLRTNNMGMRNDRDSQRRHSGLRIIFNGDSHTDGIVPNDESFTHLLADRLRAERGESEIESLNSGVGGYHFYNYLGAAQCFVPWRPNVYVLVVYGGNDFAGPMPLQRYFHDRGPPSPKILERKELMDRAEQVWDGPWGPITNQELAQALYFQENPEDISWATGLAAATVTEIEEICRELGVSFLCVYLPPALTAQPQHYPERRAAALGLLEELDVSLQALEVSNQIADRFLELVRSRGVTALDLREAFAAAGQGYYWRTDLHLSTLGNEAVADLLVEPVAKLIDLKGE